MGNFAGILSKLSGKKQIPAGKQHGECENCHHQITDVDGGMYVKHGLDFCDKACQQEYDKKHKEADDAIDKKMKAKLG
jgi:hypothetical protein